jgi:hypothetical protein
MSLVQLKVGGLRKERKMLTIDDVAEFTWGFGQKFFLETSKGNYIWSSPDYDGDNTITKFNGGYKDWLKKEKIPYGRDKGTHFISDYCGMYVEIKEEQ